MLGKRTTLPARAVLALLLVGAGIWYSLPRGGSETPPKADEKAAEAVVRFRKAADARSFAGMVLLGRAYEKGYGVKKDDVAATRLYTTAANAGDCGGIIALGRIQSYGMSPNLKESVRLFTQAVDMGCAEGMFRLAILYQKGAGVTRDDAQAFELYKMSAEAGFPAPVERAEIAAADTGSRALLSGALPESSIRADLVHGLHYQFIHRRDGQEVLRRQLWRVAYAYLCRGKI